MCGGGGGGRGVRGGMEIETSWKSHFDHHLSVQHLNHKVFTNSTVEILIWVSSGYKVTRSSFKEQLSHTWTERSYVTVSSQRMLFFFCTLFRFKLSVLCFVWFLNVLVNYKAISRTGPKTERLTILRAATHERELETITSVSAGHILTPTQPVGSGRPQRESNPGPPH